MGETRKVIEDYLNNVQSSSIKTFNKKPLTNEAQIHKVSIKDGSGKNATSFAVDESFQIEIEYELKQELPAFVIFKLFKTSITHHYIFVSLSNDNNQVSPNKIGVYRAILKIDPLLNAGVYSFVVGVSTDASHYLDRIEEYNMISIRNDSRYAFPTAQDGRRDALIVTLMEWKVEKIEN